MTMRFCLTAARGISMMNSISSIYLAARVSRCNYFTMRSLYGFSSAVWKRGTSIRSVGFELDFTPMRVQVQCYSGRRARTSLLPKVTSGISAVEEGDAFFVVRKGDLIAVFKSLSDCQSQVSTSVCDPSVSVYKGYSLRKETEEYLASRGLKNALYSFNVADIKEDLFGTLSPCPFQQPDGLAFLVDKASTTDSTPKETEEGGASTAVDTGVSKMSCILEFDGSSKGNPGKAGAGAILRAEDGSVIFRLREGLGVATNNVAEYRAMILGMKHALKKGFRQIHVQGDSHLVCMQIQNLWKTRHRNLINLSKEAKDLKNMFLSFTISHVKREFNSDADAQANLAVDLPDGEVYEDCSEVQ